MAATKGTLLLQMPPGVVLVSVMVEPMQTVLLPVIALTTGKGFTVTEVTEEVAEHPLPSVSVTVLVPVLFTLIDCVVSPLLHKQEDPEVEFNVTEPPLQNVVGPPALMVTVGNGFTVTVVTDDIAEHPFPSVIVTVRVPVLFTLID